MGNLAKRLILAGLLSLPFFFNNAEAQFLKKNPVNLKAMYRTYNFEDYDKIKINIDYGCNECKITNNPALYSGCVLLGTFAINETICQNNHPPSACVYISGAVISTIVHEISRKIIKERREKKKL